MKELTIEVSDAERKKAREHTIHHLRMDTHIPGFRKGKAPDKLIVNHYGEGYIAGKTELEAINEGFKAAVLKENLYLIDEPRDLEVTSENPLIFKLKVSVLPEVKIDDSYKKIKIKDEKVVVKQEEVKKVFDDTRARFTEYRDAKKGKVEKLDRVTFDFRGVEPKDESPIPNTDSKDYTLVVGSNSFIPGFEDEMMGLSASESKDFIITFPKDYHNAFFQSKKVKFYITIHKVEKAELPEINEDFTLKIRGKKMNEKEFMQDIEQSLLREKIDQIRTKREDEFLGECAVKFVKDDLPSILVEEELKHMETEMKQNLGNSGLSIEDYLAHLGKSMDVLKKEWFPDAEVRAKKRLILASLLKHAHIHVEDADIDSEIEKIAENYTAEDMKQKVRDVYSKEEARKNLVSRVELQKFFDEVLK